MVADVFWVQVRFPEASVLGGARDQAQGARHRNRRVTQPGKFFQIGFPDVSVPGDARGTETEESLSQASSSKLVFLKSLSLEML
jgi:hypothetical protein